MIFSIWISVTPNNLGFCLTFLVWFKAWQPVNRSPESVKSNPQSLHRSGSDMFQVFGLFNWSQLAPWSSFHGSRNKFHDKYYSNSMIQPYLTEGQKCTIMMRENPYENNLFGSKKWYNHLPPYTYGMFTDIIWEVCSSSSVFNSGWAVLDILC